MRFNEGEPICFPEYEKKIEDTAHNKAAEIAANSPIFYVPIKSQSYHEVIQLIPNSARMIIENLAFGQFFSILLIGVLILNFVMINVRNP